MKVGVDGVLLGAWVDVENDQQILDIGTGTGLIALMLAQRSEAQITAIEIEENAATEAAQNVSASPWPGRVTVIHTSLQEFGEVGTAKFDHIVSNPPFFSKATRAAYTERTMARHNDSLPFETLIRLSEKLLSDKEKLSVVLPVEAANELDKLAFQNGMFLNRRTDIRPKESKKVNRVLLTWGKLQAVPTLEKLTIYHEDGTFTKDYVLLTRDFYLKF